MAERLTHSRLSCYRACPRRHYLRYELGLRSSESSTAMKVGSAFHAALEAMDKGLDIGDALEPHVDDPFDLALVAAMIHTHTERWGGDRLEVLASELEFELPLRNPETGSPTQVWTLAGVIDRLVKLPDGRIALQEYKTTTRDFSPGADYWVGLHLDQQLSIYVLAARELGYDVSTILYDVTRRPTMRPKLATPVEERKYTAKKSKRGGVEYPAGSLYANQRETDETAEEFAARVTQAIEEDPMKHFARIEIARLDQDLLDCAAEVWVQQKVIRSSQKSGGWYRNPISCFNPYPCSYLNVCQNRDLETNTPDGFVRDENVHAELTTHATDGG
jgi:RecB family exonuclease